MPKNTNQPSKLEIMGVLQSPLKELYLLADCLKLRAFTIASKWDVKFLKKDDVVFDIVGDGNIRKEFERMIPAEFINEFIFRGWKDRDKVNQMFMDCYLLVFPFVYP